MCGIAGAVYWDAAPPAREHDALVARMVDALAHRGPDGRGVTMCSADADRTPRAVFGHTRLSIIDLSERGRQPMTSPRRPIVVAYNGEIFNFGELRRMLESHGRTFSSDSDTEVLLQGYEVWGPAVVERLRGMFAFAIWDDSSHELFLARDRVGIKPLYVYQDTRRLLFASEVRALLVSGAVDPRLDRVALDQYLAYQSVPAPRTLVRGIAMLRPGRFLVASATRRVEREYWDPLTHATPGLDEVTAADARQRLHELLEESIQLHLVSDVPVGVFLSGGIDSAAIVSLMRQQGVQARTFTVASPGALTDEGPEAREVARILGTTHTELALTPEDICATVPGGLEGVDHPTGDGLNTYVVAQAVHRAGVKVALSGLGGDELFGGYPSFRRLGRVAPLARVWQRSPQGMRQAAAAAVRTLGGHSVSSTKTAALLESDGTLPQMFPVLRQMFTAKQRAALLGPETTAASRASGDPYVELLEAAEGRRQDADTLAMVAFAETRTYMHDVLLRDTDQMSMRHGLEVRVPLLDHRLVEYVMGLPDAVRAGGNTPKPLLVESLGAPLPDACLRPKRGFVLPFWDWMRGPLRPYCEARLGDSGLAGRGLLEAAGVRSIWWSFLAGERSTSWSRVWTLVALDAWLEQTGVSS